MNAGVSRPVLLLGSLPLPSASAVFEAATSALDGLLRRLPDGETGPRADGMAFLAERLRGAKGVDVVSERTLLDGATRPVLATRAGARTCDLLFGSLGYADAALASYAEFQRLRQDGVIPTGVRFQVGLPTPLVVLLGFFAPASVRTAWPALERRILLELDAVLAAIPAQDLAIQWELSVELARILEFPEAAKAYPAEELAAAVTRLAENVPAEVELGIHFCYGGMGHRHVVEPRDAGLMVAFANRLAAAAPRPIDWLHLPVPQDRDDDEFFAPLAELRVAPQTELYLGLIHPADGLEGARRRLAAAQRIVTDFGVAAECGLGHLAPDTLPDILALHRAVAEL